jgi:hypothetical protein
VSSHTPHTPPNFAFGTKGRAVPDVSLQKKEEHLLCHPCNNPQLPSMHLPTTINQIWRCVGCVISADNGRLVLKWCNMEKEMIGIWFVIYHFLGVHWLTVMMTTTVFFSSLILCQNNQICKGNVGFHWHGKTKKPDTVVDAGGPNDALTLHFWDSISWRQAQNSSHYLLWTTVAGG